MSIGYRQNGRRDYRKLTTKGTRKQSKETKCTINYLKHDSFTIKHNHDQH